jgi:hypothetical protein
LLAAGPSSYERVMRFLAALLLSTLPALAFAADGTGPTPGWSAEYKRVDGETPGPAFAVHYSNGRLRIDYPEGNGLTEIWDFNRKIQIGLIHAQKVYIERSYQEVVKSFGGATARKVAELRASLGSIKEEGERTKKQSELRFLEGMLNTGLAQKANKKVKVGRFECELYTWKINLGEKATGCFDLTTNPGGVAVGKFSESVKAFLLDADKAGSTADEIENMFGVIPAHSRFGFPIGMVSRTRGTLELTDIRAVTLPAEFFGVPAGYQRAQ